MKRNPTYSEFVVWCMDVAVAFAVGLGIGFYMWGVK